MDAGGELQLSAVLGHMTSSMAAATSVAFLSSSRLLFLRFLSPRQLPLGRPRSLLCWASAGGFPVAARAHDDQISGY